MRCQHGCKGLLVALVGLIVSFGVPEKLLAIPAFARQYKTSCQTCHVAFPQLTPFGEAFRLNGYRFPGNLDEEYTKVEQFNLGAEGYKKLWPESVWPTTLSWFPPISVLLDGEATYTPNTKILDRQATSLNGLGGRSEIMAGGTLGDSFSYFMELEFATDVKTGDDVVAETALERSFLTYKAFDDPYLNFKVGFFEPGVSNLSGHRRLNRSPYLFLKQGRPGASDFSLEDATRGVETYGILFNGRTIYNLGLIEGKGNFDPLSEKDVYLRLGYKLGGLRLDGVAENAEAQIQNPRPWAERSLTISVFGLNGVSSVDDTAVGGDGHRDQFGMVGSDLRMIFEDATVTVGGTLRTDDAAIPVSATNADRANSSNVFVEGQYVVYPWLIPSVRYENFNQTSHHARERVDATLTILLRANVKTTLFYVYDTGLEEDDQVTGNNNNIFGIGLDLAF